VSFLERTRRGHLHNQVRGSQLGSLYYQIYSTRTPLIRPDFDLVLKEHRCATWGLGNWRRARCLDVEAVEGVVSALDEGLEPRPWR
jgi:hypothetical protein